jgi:hypothetical protein
MKKLYGLLIIPFIFIQTSCKNEKTGNDEPAVVIVEQEPPKPPLSTQAIIDEHAEIIEIIKQYDVYSAERNDVYYIQKINMGIPSGDNWLVVWGNIDSNIFKEFWRGGCYLCIYVTYDNKVIRGYKDIPINITNPLYNVSFDIMEGIPGKRIGEGGAAIWDYNKDGYDEILSLAFLGIGNTFTITGYDPREDKIVNYCETSFDVEDKEKGPPPVKFITYEGKDGFQIFSKNIDGSPHWAFYFTVSNSSWFDSLETYEPE